MPYPTDELAQIFPAEKPMMDFIFLQMGPSYTPKMGWKEENESYESATKKNKIKTKTKPHKKKKSWGAHSPRYSHFLLLLQSQERLSLTRSSFHSLNLSCFIKSIYFSFVQYQRRETKNLEESHFAVFNSSAKRQIWPPIPPLYSTVFLLQLSITNPVNWIKCNGHNDQLWVRAELFN